MLSTWFFLFWTFPILFVFKIILIIFNIFVITSFIIVIFIITKVFQRLNKTKQADQWTVRKMFDQPWQLFSPIITGKNHNKAVLLEKLKVEGRLMLWTFEIHCAPHITFMTELRFFFLVTKEQLKQFAWGAVKALHWMRTPWGYLSNQRYKIPKWKVMYIVASKNYSWEIKTIKKSVQYILVIDCSIILFWPFDLFYFSLMKQ